MKYTSKVTERNNSSYSFFSQEDAEKNAVYLDDKGCTNCEDCVNCTNCEDCISCIDCTTCENCINCVNCTNCEDCTTCEDCAFGINLNEVIVP